MIRNILAALAAALIATTAAAQSLLLGVGPSFLGTVASYPSAIFDDFASPTGTITGRTTPQGGGTWQILQTGVSVNPLAITTAGFLSGTASANSANVYGVIQTPATAAKWVTNATRLLTMSYLPVMHYSYNAGTYGESIGPNLNAIKAYKIIAGTSTALTGNTNFFYFYALDFDVFQRRETISSGTVTFTNWLNGRQLGGASTMDSGVPVSYAYGFNGFLPTTAGGIVDYFEVGDPATQGMISLYAPARIVQRDANGGLTLRIAGEFSGGVAPSVDYQVRDFTTGAVLIARGPLPNYVSGPSAYPNAPALAFSGRAAPIASPPSGGVYVEVWRNDIAGGLSAYSRGGVQKAGQVVYGNGQSLFTHRWNSAGVGSAAAQAGDWQFYASQGGDNTILFPNNYNRYQTQLVANTANTNFLATLRSIVPALANEPFAIMNGGRGATTCQTRAPVSAGGTGVDNDAQKDGIALGGFNWKSGILNFGQTDADTGVEATMMSYLGATLDSDEAMGGTVAKYVVEQLSATWGGSDVHYEAVRRAAYMATVGSSRYFLGPSIADLQHITATFPNGDNYHLNAAGIAEQVRRSAYSWAKMMGYITFDRSGPKIVSATRSGDTVTVIIDLNGADSVSVINGSVYGDYAGGLRFSLSALSTTARGTTLGPISATSGSITGTPGTAGATQTVAFAFAAGTITGPVWVGGPFGAEPFNPLGATGNGPTIRFNMATQASMLAGAKSGEPPVPVQPYYSPAGDFVVAS